ALRRRFARCSTHCRSTARRQRGTNRPLRSARNGGRRPRQTAVSGRARPAHLRERLEDRVAALADASDDADQRVPLDPHRAEGPPVPRAGDGEVLLRRGLRKAARIPPEIGLQESKKGVRHHFPGKRCQTPFSENRWEKRCQTPFSENRCQAPPPGEWCQTPFF